MASDNDDWVRAFHESGHVVAGWVLGAELRRATIEPGHDHHGIVQVHLAPWDVGRSSVTFLLAGGIAERIAFPASDWRTHSAEDLEAVARTFAREPNHPERARLERMAEGLVQENWEAVENVARLLLERRTLDGTILEAALNDRFTPWHMRSQGAEVR